MYVKRFVLLSGSGCGCGINYNFDVLKNLFITLNLLGLNLNSPRVYVWWFIYNSIGLNSTSPIFIHDFFNPNLNLIQ